MESTSKRLCGFILLVCLGVFSRSGLTASEIRSARVPPGAVKLLLENETMGSGNIDYPLLYLYVVVDLSSGGPTKMGLDTGDSTSFLFESAARRRQLPLVSVSDGDSIYQGTGLRTTVAGMASVPVINFGSYAVPKGTLEIRRDLTSTSRGDRSVDGLHQDKCDGVLGTDVLNRVDWCLSKSEKALYMYAAGQLTRDALVSAGYVVTPLSVGEDKSLRVREEFLGTGWNVALDTGASYLLYEDALAHKGLGTKVINMTAGRSTTGSTRYVLASELRVGGVTFGRKIIPVGDRITPSEDGLVGGNFLDNAVVCVSAQGGLFGVSKIGQDYSQEDLNVFAPESWTQAQKLYDRQQFGPAAGAFEEYAKMFAGLHGPGALKNYLSGRLMEASARMNIQEDKRALELVLEIQRKDPSFQPENIKSLLQALR